MKKGLILVDPTTSDISASKATTDGRMTSTKIMQVPRRIGVEDFCNLPTYAAFRASEGPYMDMRNPNLREDMLRLFQVQQPPECDISKHHSL